MIEFSHKPVMLESVLENLDIQEGDFILDGTCGGGGHSLAMITRAGKTGYLVALDQDTWALDFASKRISSAGFTDNTEFIHSNFRQMKEVLKDRRPNKILLDLGVSSFQLDEPSRGFSYMNDGPLDMRMDQNAAKPTAKDLVNTLDEKELERIIFSYGEERWAKRIAQFIVSERKVKEISTTYDLVEVIKKAIPKGAREEGHHPAKRTFQALRIAVNGELEILEDTVKDAVDCLAPGGRLAVITFHSLEDRIVKNKMKELEKGCICPKDIPVCVCGRTSKGRVLTSKPILPKEEELEDNPRARSAKLRVFSAK